MQVYYCKEGKKKVGQLPGKPASLSQAQRGSLILEAVDGSDFSLTFSEYTIMLAK